MNRRRFCRSLAAMSALSAGGLLPAADVENPTTRQASTESTPQSWPEQLTIADFSDYDLDRYTTSPNLNQQLLKDGFQMTFKAATRDEWAAWNREAVEKLRELLHYDRLRKTAPDPKITEEVDCGDHVRQRIEIHTEPGITMPFFALIPKKGEPPFPAVIALHGHGAAGKFTVAGLYRDNPKMARAIEHYHYDYGLQLVREGFITFCPDARGFGERLESPYRTDPFSEASLSCQLLKLQADGLGLNLIGMQVWDVHRLIDFIETRPDCRPGGVGCVGLSGGGCHTLYAAALDERIQCAVISGYMAGIHGMLFNGLNCRCQYIPGIWRYFDLGDVAAMIAPRALVVETGDRDLPGGKENITSQIDIIRRAYETLNAGDQFAHDVFPGGHQWHGAVAVPMLKKIYRQSQCTQPKTVIIDF